jgi:hypothetical protein
MDSTTQQSPGLFEAGGLAVRAFPRQVQQFGLNLVAATGFAVLVFTAALILSKLEGVPPSLMTRDALHTLDGQVYVGFVSSLGILFWTMAATTCLLTAFVVRGSHSPRDVTGFFLGFGLLATVLALDDLYMLHDKILPFFTRLPQHAFSGSYALAALLLIVRFRSVILRTPWLLLACSLACLGLSAAMDFGLPDLDRIVFVEDWFKFLGILCWTSYFVRCGAEELRGRWVLRPRPGEVSKPGEL